MIAPSNAFLRLMMQGKVNSRWGICGMQVYINQGIVDRQYSPNSASARANPENQSGFKIPRWQRRAGSIPAPGTIKIKHLRTLLRNPISPREYPGNMIGEYAFSRFAFLFTSPCFISAQTTEQNP